MFTDIHCHILHGTDDGPKQKDEMIKMLEHAYNDGIRVLCATPHFNYSFYGDNVGAGDKAFDDLIRITNQKYPDMKIYRGNEIFYHNECVEHLKHGTCKTLNGTKYALIDFHSGEHKFTIVEAIKHLIGNGYIPILAHIERYHEFGILTKHIEDMKSLGALIQVNAASVIGQNGIRQNILSNALISKELCDFICTDAHNTDTRSSCMRAAYNYISKRYGKETAYILTSENARRILNNERIS